MEIMTSNSTGPCAWLVVLA